MIGFYKRNKENIDKILMFLIFLICIFVFFKFVAKYFAPFIFGYIFSLILYPLAGFLQKKFKMPKALSAVISIVALFLIVGSVGAGIIAKITYEAKAFSNDIPMYIEAVIEDFEHLQVVFQDKLALLPDWLKIQISNNFDNIIGFLTSGMGKGVKSGSVGIVKKIPTFIMIIVFGFISCFFILKDKEEIDNFIFRQFPKSLQTRINVIKVGLIGAVSGYVRAQLIMMLIIGSISALALSILGSPYALFLAVVIAFIDALPVFGSGAIFWPWALYSLINGEYKKAIYLIIINLVILLTRQITEPRILGNQIGINPLITLTSIYCGLKIFGFLGIILGPMFVLIIKAMQDAELLPKWK